MICAISDVHYPRFKEAFLKALKQVKGKKENVKLIFLAGDMINRGEWKYYREVYELLRKAFGSATMVACFGNEEYEKIKGEIVNSCPEITFLDDESAVFEIAGEKIGVVGTKGVIDSPTPWQRRNIANIEEIYSERLKKVENLLRETRKRAETLILLSHYAASYETLRGESPAIYRFLGSRKMEEVVKKTSVDLVIHGHVHHGSSRAKIGKTEIFNVALPLNRKFIFINIKERKTGLEAFIKG